MREKVGQNRLEEAADALRALYSPNSTELRARVIVIVAPAFLVSYILGRPEVLILAIAYLAGVGINYRLASRAVADLTQAKLTRIVVIEACVQTIYMLYAGYLWLQPELVLQLGALALIIGAAFNALALRSRLKPFVWIDGLSISAAIILFGVVSRDLFQSPAGGYLAIGITMALAAYYIASLFEIYATRHAVYTSLEEKAEAEHLKSVGRLTAGIAHDFNNILTAVMGNLELLPEVSDPKEKDALAREARESAKRASDVTSQLLAFSRQTPLISRTIEMDTFADRFEADARAILPEEIEFTATRHDGLWPVHADETQLARALMSLIKNASDAMPRGGKLNFDISNQLITDTNAQKLPDDSYVVLTVRDTGEGIAEEIRKKVFDPFFTTKSVGSGSGLGLSMAKGFSAQSGGALILTSAPKAGTEVRMILPGRPAG
ncbi:MAG: hypothetical protein HKP40_05230 [Litoreibacter sp.]|nr:hypothetical protein [Litoreibacter sp.]